MNEIKIMNLDELIKKIIKKQCQECKERTEREKEYNSQETEERERENG